MSCCSNAFKFISKCLLVEGTRRSAYEIISRLLMCWRNWNQPTYLRPPLTIRNNTTIGTVAGLDLDHCQTSRGYPFVTVVLPTLEASRMFPCIDSCRSWQTCHETIRLPAPQKKMPPCRTTMHVPLRTNTCLSTLSF